MSDIPENFDDVLDPRLLHTAELMEKIAAKESGEGISFAVRQNGKLLLSMTRGRADNSDKRMAHETLMPIFSGTKGLMAATVAVLVDRGFVNYDDLLSKYWSAAPWPDLTVAMCLSHRAGLPHIDPTTGVHELWDSEIMLRNLAATKQLFPSGTNISYHWLNFGWFAHAIISAVTGMSAGQAFSELIARPYNIDAYLGVPDSELHRVGEVIKAPDYRTNVFANNPELIARVYGNPRLLDGEEMPWNDRGLMKKELPGGGARATAEGMSKFYDTLLMMDSPSPLLTSSGLMAAWTPKFEGIDAVTNRPIAMAMGFEREDSINSYGPVGPAFGHTGAGGSIHGCWPFQKISFSFIPRVMRTDQEDQRGKSLLKAVARDLA